jgi:catechol 2,3-dioxygenase-like lactoylglutathione lyase family enzyme
MYGTSVRLAAVRIFVTDLARSTEWFRDLLGNEPTAGAAASGYVVFDIGADLVLETVGADSDIAAEVLIGRFTGISLAVNDIAAALLGLADAVDVVGEPELQSWGGTLATIADLDGNQLQLVQYP